MNEIRVLKKEEEEEEVEEEKDGAEGEKRKEEEIMSQREFGRRHSNSWEDRIAFCIDEMSAERFIDIAPEFQHHPNCYSLYPISPDEDFRRAMSICSQSERPRRASRQGSDAHLASRRCSVHSSHSRTRANSRVTPLGNGRRASVCKRGNGRRASSAHRRDSVRPSRDEIKVPPIELKTPEEIQQARRHRRIAMIVVATFMFLLIASVLAVVVTLTHSSFYIPPLAPKELNKLRDHEIRKENEALMNSLNHDSSVQENSTASPEGPSF